MFALHASTTTLLLALLLAAPRGGAAIPTYTESRLGDIEVGSWAGFAVAADEVRHRIHFVFRDRRILYHTISTDGGLTWSPKVVVDKHGMQMDMALDSHGELHLVYGCENEDSPNQRVPKNVLYRVFRDNHWSDSTALEAKEHYQAQVMRIAVDGNDNVHIIYHDEGAKYYPGTTKDNLEDDRCVYVRKPHGGAWEAPQRWAGKYTEDHAGCFAGDMFVDPNGDVHFIYVSMSTAGRYKVWLERRTRYKTGEWGHHVAYPNARIGNEQFGGAFAADGSLLLAGVSSTDAMKVMALNVGEESTAYRQIYMDPQDRHGGADMVREPNGDLWVAVGNWHGNWKSATIGAEHQQAFYYHFDATTGTWSGRINIAPLPPQAIYVDTFWDTTPKLIRYDGKVRLFYGRKLQGESFKFWMRVFGDIGEQNGKRPG